MSHPNQAHTEEDQAEETAVAYPSALPPHGVDSSAGGGGGVDIASFAVAGAVTGGVETSVMDNTGHETLAAGDGGGEVVEQEPTSLLVASSIAPGEPSPPPRVITTTIPQHQHHIYPVHEGYQPMFHGMVTSPLPQSRPGYPDQYAIDPSAVVPHDAAHERPAATTDQYDQPDEADGGDEDASAADEVLDEANGPVKLFVGQVPKFLEETDLFPIFSKYGPLEDIAIIRDKHTGQHRGCAFVTFLHATDSNAAIEDLHDKHTLPRGRRPMQIRPASEPTEANKLFVGMIPRTATEQDLREIFLPFGEIHAVYMIRSNDGARKGCAFVKFARREFAATAIEELHEKYTMEGMTRPLIVKFADPNKTRRPPRFNPVRRIDGQLPYGMGMAPGHHHGAGPYYLAPGHPMQPAHFETHPHIHHPAHPHRHGPPHLVQQYPQYSAPAATAGPYHGNPPGSASPPPHPHLIYQPPYGMPPAPSGAGEVNRQGFTAPGSNPQSDGSSSSSVMPVEGDRKPQAYPGSRRYNSPATDRSQAGPIIEGGRVSAATTPRPREGPAGANLFIYHLPHDLTDADLATAFNSFGNVISAKVYVDRYTGESKGFGFVSYDSVISAEHAIEQMNGFQIGSKRLKVQHKRINNRHPQQMSAGPHGGAMTHHHPHFHQQGGPPHLPHHQVQQYTAAHAVALVPPQTPASIDGTGPPPPLEISSEGEDASGLTTTGQTNSSLTSIPQIDAVEGGGGSAVPSLAADFAKLGTSDNTANEKEAGNES